MAEEKFNPPGCEYTIEFPNTPQLFDVQKAMAAGSTTPLSGAKLALHDGNVLLQAECVNEEQSDLSQINDESMQGFMEFIASDVGLSRSSFKLESSGLGLVGEITGFKDSEQGSITMRIINYIGSRSIFTVYLVSYSKIFPTSEILTFSNTVERE